MKTLMFYAPTWHRLRTALAAMPRHRVALLRPDGGLDWPDGGPFPIDAAWLDTGLWLADMVDDAARVLRDSPVQWVQTGTSGVDSPHLASLIQRGVTVSRTQVQSVGVAEFVLCRVMAHFQQEGERAALQARRQWAQLTFREVRGSRWLIVGFGAIGRAVAVRARAFGAEIVGVRRDPSPDPAADRMVSPDALRAEAALADVVVLSVPLTPATENLADRPLLAAMKPDAVLVNVGRGGLVDEAALIDALDAGRIEHAILDVTRVEPLPVDHRLWSHPRVAITGHASARGHGLHDRAERFGLENIRRYLSGEPVLNVAG